MNKDVEALIDSIEIDEHLAHYQRLTHAQRAALLGELVSFSRSIKRSPLVERRVRRLEQRRFTPALCREFLKK